MQAYSERRFEGNLADLLLSYGFTEPVRKQSFWALRHFWKPRQANPSKLKRLFELAQKQGMLFTQADRPIAIDSRKIPADLLSGFATRDCSALACAQCGYCERIAEQAVTVKPGFREEILKLYAATDDAMATGEFWNV